MTTKNSNQIKVSVIIPIYNTEQYLRECLDSVVNQTLRDIEIICIDDKSTDNSLSILEEYKKKDKRIMIIKQKTNQGQGTARNIGIKKAKGKYIMFVDADDWIELNSCEELYNHIEKYKNDVVFFGMNRYDNVKKTKYSLLNSRIRTDLNQASIDFSSNKINLSKLKKPFELVGEACWKFIRRDFIIENNIYFENRRLCEDEIFAYKCYTFAKSSSFLQKGFYNYRRNNTKSSTNQANMYQQLMMSRNNSYDFIKENSTDIIVKSYLIHIINGTFMFFSGYSMVLPLTQQQDFYSQMKNYFTKIYSENDLTNIKQYIYYSELKKVVDYSFDEYINIYTKRIKLFGRWTIATVEKKNIITTIKLFNFTLLRIVKTFYMTKATLFGNRKLVLYITEREKPKGQ